MNIRDIRKELCLSQVEFARLLGVHQTAVSQWETGRTRPEVEIAKRISRISGHTLSEVLNDESAPPADEEGIVCLPVSDDGLRGQRILKGDLVYLRPQENYRPGEIVALETPEGVAVRLLLDAGNRALLFSDTPRPTVAEISENTHFLGKVIGFYSEIAPRA